MGWSTETTSRLIELFKAKRVLWDPTLKDYKDRNKKHDAWAELGTDMQMDAFDVEKKMRRLIGQFARELKKGKSGDGVDAPYKSRWMFFTMLMFLKDKNAPRHSTEAGFSRAHTNRVSVQSQALITEGEVSNTLQTCQQTAVEEDVSRQCVKSTKRKADTMSEEVYAVIKHLSSNVKQRDAFDVFGEYVANSLRNLKDQAIKSDAKFHISNVLYQAEIDDLSQQTSRNTPEPPTLSASSTPISFDATPALSSHSSCTEQNDENDTDITKSIA